MCSKDARNNHQCPHKDSTRDILCYTVINTETMKYNAVQFVENVCKHTGYRKCQRLINLRFHLPTNKNTYYKCYETNNKII